MATAKELWVEDPPSEKIAAELNRTCAYHCQHARDPCYLRCGVRKTNGRWFPISRYDRQVWARGI